MEEDHEFSCNDIVSGNGHERVNTSILGRAASNGLLSFEAINIRDYTLERHGKVDDYPYGGGAEWSCRRSHLPRLYGTLRPHRPQAPGGLYDAPGTDLYPEDRRGAGKGRELVFLCGHYEGVDERVLEMIATDYLSAGDYVLTGGELPGHDDDRLYFQAGARRFK